MLSKTWNQFYILNGATRDISIVENGNNFFLSLNDVYIISLLTLKKQNCNKTCEKASSQMIALFTI
jgi:hypothetical protein